MTLTQLASDNILTQKKGAFLCLQALPPPHNVVNNESVRVDPGKMLLREIALDKSSPILRFRQPGSRQILGSYATRS